MITKELQKMKPLRGDEKFERDSEYMGADDIDNGVEPVLTIKNLYRGKVTLQRGPEVKNVLTFVEESVPGISEVRPLIVNSTNRQVLKKLYGQVTANALEGKKIQLYIEHGVRNPAKNELTDGIRIREKKPSSSGKAAEAPKCSVCGKEITGISGISAADVAKKTKEKYGKQMCSECAAKKKAEMEEAAKAAAEQAAQVEEENHVEPSDNDLAAQLAAAAAE